MYNIIIWLALFVSNFDEVLPIYDPNLLFKDKKSCEEYIKTNYSVMSLQIEKQFQFQKDIQLKEIITMECIIIGSKI
jgi:hypothetical protein